MPPEISVVIPAYKEGERLPPFLEQLVDALVRQPTPVVELVVVDDGSGEAHAQREREAVKAGQQKLELAGSAHRLTFVGAEVNRGKGGAIRRGWEEAAKSARWLGFLDADGAICAEEFCRMARMLEASEGFDVLAGSRIRMAGRDIQRSLFRHLQGRVFATLTEVMLGLGFYDTQCGAKFFRASVLRPELERLAEERWLLDLEVLALMQNRGARFMELPIDWTDQADSRVRFLSDAAKMFLGLRQIQRRRASWG